MPYTDNRDQWTSGQGLWSHVPAEQWNDWAWQLKNRVTTLADLERLMELTPDERAGCEYASHKLAMAITPYFFNLIDRNDPDCPVRKQLIPRSGESVVPPRSCSIRWARSTRCRCPASCIATRTACSS